MHITYHGLAQVLYWFSRTHVHSDSVSVLRSSCGPRETLYIQCLSRVNISRLAQLVERVTSTYASWKQLGTEVSMTRSVVRVG